MNEPGIYRGFSTRARLAIVLGATVIAVFVFIHGISLIDEAMGKLELGDNDVRVTNALINNNAPQSATTDSAAVAARIVIVQSGIHLKHIVNEQTLNVVAIFAAFALIVIGFALFLIGADGAFEIQAKTGGSKEIAFTGTAPGLFCFALAGLLIYVAITQHQQIQLPALKVNPTPPPASSDTQSENTGSNAALEAEIKRQMDADENAKQH